MGVMNFLLKGLGFGDEKAPEEVKPVSVYVKQTEPTPAPPALPIVRPINETQNKEVSLNNLVVYAPKNMEEIHRLVDCLKKGEAIIIDLSNMKKTEVQRILDYLNGGLQALSGTINRLQGNLFVLTPKNINITTI